MLSCCRGGSEASERDGMSCPRSSSVRVALKPRDLVHRAGEGEVCVAQRCGLWVHDRGRFLSLVEPWFSHL